MKIHNYCKDNEMQNRRWEYFCERNLELRGWWGCNEIRYLLADCCHWQRAKGCCYGSELKVENTGKHSRDSKLNRYF